MSESTEAEMLHQAGAAYRRRVGLVDSRGNLTFAGIKPGVFSVYLGESPHIHYDLEGRWQRMVVGLVHHLRGLDGRVTAVDRVREHGGLVIHRRELSFAEAADLDSDARSHALTLLEGVRNGSLKLESPPAPAAQLEGDELRELLERVVRWDAAAWFRDREAFVETYGTVGNGFLPPSCSSPIVVRATCSSDPSARGVLRADPAATYALSDDEFRTHVARVSRLLGRRVAQARGLVLADGEALRRQADQILPWLDAARELFPVRAASAARKLADRPIDAPELDGIYAFLNSPGQPLPTRDGWRDLAAAQLRRVDVGVVSGDEAIRRALHQTWNTGDLAELTSSLRAAGIAIGLVVVVGAGGRAGARSHVEETVRLVESVNLAAGDGVYLVPAHEVIGPTGEDDALDHAQIDAQIDTFVSRFAGLRGRKVKVSPYTIAKQTLS